MQLVSPLAAGVRGAKNGTATICVRGTTTAASIYLDANGGRRLTGTVALDAFGSVQCYVDQVVDVTVLSSAGSTVRTFTAGSTAGAVEVDSSAFSGVSYSTGAPGNGEPVGLDTLLSMALTSFGATDFQVSVSGVTLTMKGAVAAFFGASVSVTSAKYDATGDGATDDQVPLQQAIDDVFAAGGGAVYLPPGNYVVGAPLRLREGVSIVGEGNLLSSITVVNNTSAVVVLNSAKPQRIRGVSFYATDTSTSTSPLVSVGESEVRLEECYFDGTNITGNIVDLAIDGVHAVLDRCVFNLVSTNLVAVRTFVDFTVSRIDVVDCTFNIGTGYASSVISLGAIHVESCLFDWSLSTSGAFSCFVLSGDCYGLIDGCEFIGASGPTPTLINIGNLNSSREFVFEDCSVIEAAPAPTMYTLNNAGSGYYARMKTVDARCAPLSTIATVGGAGNVHFIVPDASQYGVFSVFNADNTAGATASGCCFGASTTSAFSATAPMGARRTAIYAMQFAEEFTKNENVSRNSVMPTWKSIAASAHAMKLVMLRNYGYSPSTGMIMRWHACGYGGGQPTVDTTLREAYAF